jgi:hypothetical protein
MAMIRIYTGKSACRHLSPGLASSLDGLRANRKLRDHHALWHTNSEIVGHAEIIERVPSLVVKA